MRIYGISQYNYFRGEYNAKRHHQTFEALTKNGISQIDMEEYNDLRVFSHHIYEYKKGLRHLILTTEKAKHRETIETRLENNNIPYLIHEINNGKINVYFGDESCINVVKTFSPKLHKLTAEQDFILGIMLGYDRVKQCDRYLKIKNKQIKLQTPQE